MKNIITKSFFYLGALTVPAIASAQLGGTRTLLQTAGELIRYATTLVAAVALLVFFWGLMKFILKIGGDAKAAEEGKKLMIWGLVALFVMVSVWGIVYWVGDELFPEGVFRPAPTIPTFPR